MARFWVPYSRWYRGSLSQNAESIQGNAPMAEVWNSWYWGHTRGDKQKEHNGLAAIGENKLAWGGKETAVEHAWWKVWTKTNFLIKKR